MSDDDIDMPDVAVKPKKGLGRGLNALFGDEEGDFSLALDPNDDAAAGKKRLTLGISQVEPNVSQPRRHFDEEALQELASSIREHGVLQPILVRKLDVAGEDRYEIIAGERRWRASQIAQKHDIPVIVLELDDEQAYQIALIENLQRRDLDPIDEAQGYQKMIDTYGYTQDKLAKVIGKSRPHIANTLRLLNLPQSLYEPIRHGELSAGHARTLVTAEDPEALAQEIIDGKLSVRQAEKRAGELAGRMEKVKKAVTGGTSPAAKGGYQKDADTIALEQEVSNSLGMHVAIDTNDGVQGTLRIQFKDLDQLDELLHRLSSLPSQRLMN